MLFFDNIDYLQRGNTVQQSAYRTLTKHRIMDLLEPYNPLLTGTVPIAINIEHSDLDIICCYQTQEIFAEDVTALFNKFNGFELTIGSDAVVANFMAGNWKIEIFGEAKPTHMQHAYRHMLVEYQLLHTHGEKFRAEIIGLKKAGYKTEPAFAKALGLTGDPYEALLALKL